MNVTASKATQASTIVGQDLVAAAASLVPTLRSRGSETDALGKLPGATIADLQNARLFDMAVPRMYGGQQSSLRTLMDAVVEIGQGDGSVAWTLAILHGGTWMAAACYPKHVTDEIFAPGENTRVATVFMPRRAKTKRINGGVMIEEGIWNFNSGVYHAQWDILGIPIIDEASQIIDRASALIPISQVSLLNDWDTIGLRGSGSTSVAVKNVFVPNERLAFHSKTQQENFAADHLRNEPLYQLPILPFLAAKLVFPALGMAKGALELFIDKASQRSISFTFYEKQDEAAVTHLQVAEASAKIDAAELMLRRCLDDLEASTASGTSMPMEQRARIWRDAGFASRLIWEVVDMLAGASGGGFAQSANPMNQYWRDVRVAGLHGGICPNTTLEVFGRILCGKTPNAPLLQPHGND
ncbi:acyl-CoA dehydrogenase [Sinorhizobium sp. CB9]